MKIHDYQQDCERTANPLEDKLEELKNWVLSLNEEAGEVAGVLKKGIYHGHDWNTDDVIDEVGDVLFYATMICSTLGYSLEECMTMNMLKRGKRYPKGFSVEDSRNRRG